MAGTTRDPSSVFGRLNGLSSSLVYRLDPVYTWSTLETVHFSLLDVSITVPF